MAQMRTLQRAALLAALIVGGGTLAFVLGVLSVQPGNDALYIIALLSGIAMAVGAALRLALGSERRLAAEVALGALLFPAFLAVFVLGVFAPYLGGWGDRELKQFGGSDMTWRPWLSFLLATAGVSGAVFGGLVGFLSWAFRSARCPADRAR
jgi:uncharacterized membrane protein (DUF4010 family)